METTCWTYTRPSIQSLVPQTVNWSPKFINTLQYFTVFNDTNSGNHLVNDYFCKIIIYQMWLHMEYNREEFLIRNSFALTGTSSGKTLAGFPPWSTLLNVVSISFPTTVSKIAWKTVWCLFYCILSRQKSCSWWIFYVFYRLSTHVCTLYKRRQFPECHLLPVCVSRWDKFVYKRGLAQWLL